MECFFEKNFIFLKKTLHKIIILADEKGRRSFETASVGKRFGFYFSYFIPSWLSK